MSVLGWNDIPEEAFAKFDFWKCPTWIRTLARVPIIEIFAYPLIVKRGLRRFGFRRVVLSKQEDLNLKAGMYD